MGFLLVAAVLAVPDKRLRGAIVYRRVAAVLLTHPVVWVEVVPVLAAVVLAVAVPAVVASVVAVAAVPAEAEDNLG